MKKLLLLLLVVLIGYSNVNSQVKKGDDPTLQTETKLSSVLLKRGDVFIKNFQYVGMYVDKYSQELEITAISIYSPGKTSIKVKGVKVTIKNVKGEETTNFLDLEEIQSAIEGINTMFDLSAKYKDSLKEYMEVYYKSKEGFSLGFYQDKSQENQTFFVSIEKYSKDASLFPKSEEDFITIKDILSNSITKLSGM